jgi:hypothetical protein
VDCASSKTLIRTEKQQAYRSDFIALLRVELLETRARLYRLAWRERGSSGIIIMRASRAVNKLSLLAMATKKKASKLPAKLSKTEENVLAHLTHGYQLEVTGAEGAPVLRRIKDNEIVRPAGVNRSTIRALEERGLICAAEGEDKLTTIWRAKK